MPVGLRTLANESPVILQASHRLHVDVRAPGDTMTVFHPPVDTSFIERVIRWFFSVPQWVQLTGVALAILVGIISLVLVVLNARSIAAWFRRQHVTTPFVWKAVIGVQALVVLAVMAGAGAGFFVYSQNNNQFCLSCHTLHDEVYQRFQQSKHHRIAGLRCHDCHDEPLTAEMTQVAKWMLFRPAAVGPHAPVPRKVCAGCHVKRDADSSWQRIIATAGHSVHLTTDTARRLRIECLTCHGVTAHRFVPVAETCAQSGCHGRMDIHLGRMAGQTSLHCVTCHQFTAPVRDAADSKAAFAGLAPNAESCLGCHEMRKVIARFVPEHDPHKGRCGDCHNPHTQTTPAAAYRTCTNSGCHANPGQLSPFHRGMHAGVLAKCGTCHQEHTWKVVGRTCLDCHQNIYRKAPTPVLRTSRRPSRSGPRSPALQLASMGDVSLLIGAAMAAREASARVGSVAEPDTMLFSHGTHSRVPCSACHSTTGPTHGSVRVRSPRDCQQCHHVTTVRTLGGGANACFHCHAEKSLPSRVQAVAIQTSTSATPITRALPFAHATHRSFVCAQCHGTPVTLAASASCAGCHAAHHDARRECRTCHAAYEAHVGQQVHLGCAGSGCHTDRAVLALGPARNVCLSCHATQVDHKPGQDCATCHRVHWTPAAASGSSERHEETRP